MKSRKVTTHCGFSGVITHEIEIRYVRWVYVLDPETQAAGWFAWDRSKGWV